MLLHIPGVLSAPDAARCREMLEQADWFEGGVDGPESAQTRHNLEIPEDHPLARQIGGHILDALQSNALFLSAALPLRVFPPLFNRYQRGDSYGAHVDNSIRQVAGTPHRVRTDLSATLFLSNPDEYEGGHMTVEDACGAQNVKLPAGHMVLYPGTSLHHVRPVTRGARVASFFWIQSMVRDDGKRTLLFDMDMAIQRIAQDTPDHASLAQLTGVYHNLIRRWAEL